MYDLIVLYSCILEYSFCEYLECVSYLQAFCGCQILVYKECSISQKHIIEELRILMGVLSKYSHEYLQEYFLKDSCLLLEYFQVKILLLVLLHIALHVLLFITQILWSCGTTQPFFIRLHLYMLFSPACNWCPGFMSDYTERPSQGCMVRVTNRRSHATGRPRSNGLP